MTKRPAATSSSGTPPDAALAAAGKSQKKSPKKAPTPAEDDAAVRAADDSVVNDEEDVPFNLVVAPSHLVSLNDRNDAHGYAMQCRQVRRYNVSDIHTVRKALNDNFVQLLTKETTCQETLFLFYCRMFVGLIAIATGIFSHFNPWRFPANYRVVLACIIGYYAAAGVMYYIFRWLEADAFYQGYVQPGQFVQDITATSPSTSGAAAAVKKPKGGRASPGSNSRRLLVRLSSSISLQSPFYHLDVSVVQPPPHWWVPAKAILAQRSFVLSPGSLFSEEGYVYPPAVRSVVASIGDLIREAGKE